MNKIDELLAKLIKKKEIDLLPISGLKEAILVQILQTLRGFPDSSVGKESACNAGDLGSIPGLGRSAGEGRDHPHQYSGLENSMDCTVHGVTKSQTQLSDFHFIDTEKIQFYKFNNLDKMLI